MAEFPFFMFGDENKTTEKKKYTNCLTPYGSNCKLINQKDYEIKLEKIILKSLTYNKPINIIQKQKSGVKKKTLHAEQANGTDRTHEH